MKRGGSARAVGLALGLLAGAASAAEPSEKEADAERLFREGQTLMADRRFGEACPKFQDAYRKDQQLGTLLNLAYCHKEQGSIWLAWLEFKEAEVKAVELKRTDRKDFARQRMMEIEKSTTLARVFVHIDAKVELTEVLVEDRRVFDAETGATFAAEPGRRKVTFRAKGKKQVVQLMTVRPKSDRAQKLIVPAMSDASTEAVETEPSAAAIANDSGPAPDRAPSAEPQTSEAGSGWRTAMWVAFGVGVPVLVVGAVTGLLSVTSECANGQRDAMACSPEARRDALTVASIATVAVPVGAVAVAAGFGILFFGPHPKPSASAASSPSGSGAHLSRGVRLAPEFGAGTAGLGVRGVF